MREFENFVCGFNFDLDSILNNKDKSGYSIWVFLLACDGMMSLEYNRNVWGRMRIENYFCSN